MSLSAWPALNKQHVLKPPPPRLANLLKPPLPHRIAVSPYQGVDGIYYHLLVAHLSDQFLVIPAIVKTPCLCKLPLISFDHHGLPTQRPIRNPVPNYRDQHRGKHSGNLPSEAQQWEGRARQADDKTTSGKSQDHSTGPEIPWTLNSKPMQMAPSYVLSCRSGSEVLAHPARTSLC